MPALKSKTLRIVDLADRLISDIESKQLQPGDPYLTTAAASKLLGVGSGVANRALQLLERRSIVVRQQRLGAFIANLPSDTPSPPLERVHFLVHPMYLTAEGVGSDLVLLGMQEELPGVRVQISFLPGENVVRYVEGLFDQASSAISSDGFILVRAPYEVQELASHRGVPAVVYGGIYPGIERLLKIDRDMAAVGELAADFLLKRGHERFVLLGRQSALPGDHDTLDAIQTKLSERGLLANALCERLVPAADAAGEAVVDRLLDSDNPPTAIVCRAKRMADGVVRSLAKRGMRIYRDVDVVVCDYYLGAAQVADYVYPRPLFSLEEQGRRIARLLVRAAMGVNCESEIIPVELDERAAQQGCR
ncbi:substrate-binding domain-containing protein [Aeoliella sp. SH292]|uniref:substrate-binding domain-containing protein n=1 Tax=Aeoliella sp. SH292 TaxID=3454464 RepID=UPI003F982744